MSTRQDVLGVVATAVAAGGVANKVLQGLIDGRVKCMVDSYVVPDTNVAAASTIKLGQVLPKGAHILAIILSSSVAQTTVTVLVGTTYDTNAFAMTGVFTAFQTALVPGIVSGAGYVVGTAALDDQIVLTTEAAVLQVGTITGIILYTND